MAVGARVSGFWDDYWELLIAVWLEGSWSTMTPVAHY
jgi:hypothetical protein